MITNEKTTRNKGQVILAINEKQILVMPGNKTSIHVGVINKGENEDYFDILVKGVPSDWITIDTPVIHLAAGVEKQVIITIQISQILPNHVSRYSLDVHAVSLSDPNLVDMAHNLVTMILYRSK